MTDSGECLAAARTGDRVTIRTASSIDGRDSLTVRVTDAIPLSGRFYERVAVTAEPVGDTEASHVEIRSRYTGTGWLEPAIAAHYPDGTTSPATVVIKATHEQEAEA